MLEITKQDIESVDDVIMESFGGRVESWERIKKYINESAKQADNNASAQCPYHNFDHACYFEFEMYCLEEPCKLSAQRT